MRASFPIMAHFAVRGGGGDGKARKGFNFPNPFIGTERKREQERRGRRSANVIPAA